MTKTLRKYLLAGLISGFLSVPALAAEPLNQGEAFFRAGQSALAHDQWYLALTLWDDIPINSEAHDKVREQFNKLKRQLNTQGVSFEQALSAKALEQAQAEADQGHWVAAIYFLGKVAPDTPSANIARRKLNAWRQELSNTGSGYEAELDRYAREYQQALQVWEYDNYYDSLRRLRRIQPDSPFFHRAQALLGYARAQIANLPQDLNSDYRPNNRPTDRPVSRPRQVERSFAIGLQGRVGFPFGDAPAGGGGLGLSWYPIPQAALHLEANLFPLNTGLIGFVPLTARYVMPIDPAIDIFLGAGGFWSAGNKVSVLGVLGEVGSTWQMTPDWALEVSGDYGIPLSSPGTQTLGLRLGVMKTF